MNRNFTLIHYQPLGTVNKAYGLFEVPHIHAGTRMAANMACDDDMHLPGNTWQKINLVSNRSRHGYNSVLRTWLEVAAHT